MVNDTMIFVEMVQEDFEREYGRKLTTDETTMPSSLYTGMTALIRGMVGEVWVIGSVARRSLCQP